MGERGPTGETTRSGGVQASSSGRNGESQRGTILFKIGSRQLFPDGELSHFKVPSKED